jgi:hypothetical protein
MCETKSTCFLSTKWHIQLVVVLESELRMPLSSATRAFDDAKNSKIVTLKLFLTSFYTLLPIVKMILFLCQKSIIIAPKLTTSVWATHVWAILTKIGDSTKKITSNNAKKTTFY